MRNNYLVITIALLLANPFAGLSQYNPDTTAKKDDNQDVYRMNNKVDVPVALVGIGGTLFGFHLRESKSDNDSLEVVSLSANSLPKYNRHVTTQNSLTASKISDVLIAEGFVLPWFLYADKKVRSEAYDYTVMYLETMGLTGMGYAVSAGVVKKYRPYAYNKEVGLKRRMNKHSSNSFYAGHVATTAAGTFFAAKVFHDMHPDSKFRHVMWGIAGASTLGQCYARYKGGFHFPSDIAIGAALGTTAGILVPTLHKRSKGSALTMQPYFGEVPGITLRYTFIEKRNALFNSTTK